MVSTSQYALNLTWLQALTGLIERLQVSLIQYRAELMLVIYARAISKVDRRHRSSLWDVLNIVLFPSSSKTNQDPESKNVLLEWQVEREELR